VQVDGCGQRLHFERNDREERTMSYSWAFLADFEIPAENVASLQATEEPFVTDLDEIRECGGLTDWIYDGARLHYRSVFEKSNYADKLEVIEELFETVIAHGGRGRASLVGFDDGGPDAGTIFEIAGGEVTSRDFESAAEAAAIRDSEGYAGLRERFTAAFADDE
jgi:hypothetical protein